MTIIRRSKDASTQDLVKALDDFISLLRGEDEEDAVAALETIMRSLAEAKEGTAASATAAASIVEAFEGELELSAYTIQRKGKPGEWTKADQLTSSSTRVFSLARRICSASK